MNGFGTDISTICDGEGAFSHRTILSKDEVEGLERKRKKYNNKKKEEEEEEEEGRRRKKLENKGKKK